MSFMDIRKTMLLSLDHKFNDFINNIYIYAFNNYEISISDYNITNILLSECLSRNGTSQPIVFKNDVLHLNNEQILNLLYDIKTIRLVLQLQYQNLKEQILNSDLKELKNIKIEFHAL